MVVVVRGGGGAWWWWGVVVVVRPGAWCMAVYTAVVVATGDSLGT